MCNHMQVAQGKIATQSSETHVGEASRAVDDDASMQWSDNSCIQTNVESSPWWKVDLVNQTVVHAVKIWSRSNAGLTNFEIRVGDDLDWNSNTKCGDKHSIGQGEAKEFFCASTVAEGDAAPSGRYLHVVLPSQTAALKLCEVKVFTGTVSVEQVIPTLSGPCFAGPSIERWKYPESCASCVGPGASQCLSCDPDHGFVIAQMNEGVAEGWCYAYSESYDVTSSMKLMPMPANPNYSPALAIQQHFLSKFGYTSAELPMKMLTLGGDTAVHMLLNVLCKVQKREICQARKSLNESTVCSVSKSASFVMIKQLRSNGIGDSAACNQCEAEKKCRYYGSPNNPKRTDAECDNADICCDIDSDGIKYFVDIDPSDPSKLSSVHELCDSVVKLL